MNTFKQRRNLDSGKRLVTPPNVSAMLPAEAGTVVSE